MALVPYPANDEWPLAARRRGQRHVATGATTCRWPIASCGLASGTTGSPMSGPGHAAPTWTHSGAGARYGLTPGSQLTAGVRGAAGPRRPAWFRPHARGAAPDRLRANGAPPSLAPALIPFLANQPWFISST